MSAALTDTRSAALYRRAVEVMPGGVNSPVRAMHAIGRDPVFVARGAGAELTDVDGNRFLDYVCSWGPLIHGHAQPDVLAAVSRAAAGGTTFGAPTAAEVDLAEEVARRMPGVQMLRMTSSGTEATMTALRLARAATGRERVLKFEGAYHGHVDGLLAKAGSGLATQALPSSPGVPEAAAAQTVLVPWNDPDALIAATGGSQAGRSELAAIIAEPLPANMGLVPPKPGFLELLRERADATGALLVLDEVISGFRVARGGAQELFGVGADLTILGKVLGGGLPAAALGGRAELMSMLAPAGPVYQAGTLSGNPLAVAAGLATLELLDEAAYARLAAITERLADGLRAAARDAWPARNLARSGGSRDGGAGAGGAGAGEAGGAGGAGAGAGGADAGGTSAGEAGEAGAGAGGAGGGGEPIQVISAPGLLTVFFSARPVGSFADAQACDLDAYAAFSRELLARGVYPPPSQFEAWFPSLAHTDEQIEHTVAAAAAAFAAVSER